MLETQTTREESNLPGELGMGESGWAGVPPRNLGFLVWEEREEERAGAGKRRAGSVENQAESQREAQRGCPLASKLPGGHRHMAWL